MPLYITVPVTGDWLLVIRKLAVVIVDTSIFSLNVAIIAVFTATSEELFSGFVDDTVGGVVSRVEPVEDLFLFFPPPPQDKANKNKSIKHTIKKNFLHFNNIFILSSWFLNWAAFSSNFSTTAL